MEMWQRIFISHRMRIYLRFVHLIFFLFFFSFCSFIWNGILFNRMCVFILCFSVIMVLLFLSSFSVLPLTEKKKKKSSFVFRFASSFSFFYSRNFICTNKSRRCVFFSSHNAKNFLIFRFDFIFVFYSPWK